MTEEMKINFENVYISLHGKERPEIKSSDYVVNKELYGAVEAAIATGEMNISF
ncbi:MAG: hypothetical protein GY941_06705 [Planctomycetes bacterium]|nr:hypothetical protein [Planctomycetota bacterium]